MHDIEQNALPQVVFYKPIGQYNLHPGYTNVTDGDKHLAELVMKLQASAAYRDMLILITWDENGGHWDHVPPPRRDRWGPGTRIPLIAVGPTVKRGYIDRTPYAISARSCARSNYARGSIRWKTQTGTHIRCATPCAKARSGMAVA